MGERKVRIADIARDTGLHRNTLTLLYKETATRVDIEAIDKLCAYFGCRCKICLNGNRTRQSPLDVNQSDVDHHRS